MPLFHATPYNELHAYYLVNFGIFLLEMLAIIGFTDVPLQRWASCPETEGPPPNRDSARVHFLLDRYPLRYLGLALLVIASQRELSLGKVRPDALLQSSFSSLSPRFCSILPRASPLRRAHGDSARRRLPH